MVLIYQNVYAGQHTNCEFIWRGWIWLSVRCIWSPI